MIKQLLEGIETNVTFKKISVLIKLFKQAIKGDQDEDVDSKYAKYFQLQDDYSEVIQYSMLRLPQIIKQFYLFESTDKLTLSHIESHIQQVLLRGFLIKSLQFLQHTIETQETDANSILFVIKALSSLNCLTSAFDSLSKKCLKLLIIIWGESNELNIKLHAFIELRKQYEKLADFQQADTLKKIYEKYILQSKHIVWRNYEGMNFMINCIVELCNMNMNQAYQVAFSSLQKLVVRLREANKDKNEQQISQIITQQTISILKLWTQVICTHNKKEQLADLMNPLVQIIISILQFNPAIEDYPFELHLTNLIIKICQNYKCTVNICQFWIDMLNCADLKRRKLKTSVKPYDFDIGTNIKLKQRQSGQYWSDICEQILNQMTIYLSLFIKKNWFNSYVIQIQKQLKKLQQDIGFVGNKIKIKEFLKLLESSINEKGETALQSRAQQIQMDWEELIKQKVLSEKERIEKGEELDESQQEIDDEKDQEYVFDEIRKYKEEKKQQQEKESDFGSEYEGDPEEIMEEEQNDEFIDDNEDDYQD